MPFQITIAIDPSRRIRKFFTKNKNQVKASVEGKNDSTKLDGSKSGSFNKEMPAPVVTTIYRSGEYAQNNSILCDKRKIDKDGKDSTNTKEAEVSSKPNSKSPKTSANNKLTKTESKTSLPGLLHKIFKKKEDQLPTGENLNAINPFNAILEDEKSLETLVGKAFTLNTMVTIQSIEDDGNPNLILTGSIPFQLATNNGVVNKRVRVKGKLYSPKKEVEIQTIKEEKSVTSINTQSAIKLKVNEQFKLDTSSIERVSWLTSQIFTQEEYRQMQGADLSDLPDERSVSSMWLQGTTTHRDGHEREMKCISDIDERETSLKIIHPVSKKSSYASAIDQKRVQLPVTSITIARSRSRIIRFSDGTNFKESIGRNVITLTAPEGILYYPDGMPYDTDDENMSTIARTGNTSGISYDDNMFTRACFQMAREECEYSLSCSMTDKKKFGQELNRTLDADVKSLESNSCYPPGNYSHILADRYNPLTWIYQNFDKTKRFIKGFKVET